MGNLKPKLYVEETIIYLLQHGYPADLIVRDPKYFGLYDWELTKNLESSYNRKSLELIEKYANFDLDSVSNSLADSYSEVYRPVAGEEYPLTKKEQFSLFKKRDELIERKDKIEDKMILLSGKKSELEEMKREYEEYCPFVKLMGEYNLDAEESKKNSSKKIDKKLKKEVMQQGLMPKNDSYYNGKYRAYKKLCDSIEEIDAKITDMKENKENIYYKRMRSINNEIDKINEKLVKTNSRLIDAFIRRKYKDLLVEQSDLYSICYLGLWRAIKYFDYNRGFMPSTYIYYCMDAAVKRNFKSLTKKTWQTYWNEKKVQMLLRNMSKILGRQATVDDLLEAGLLDMTEKVAHNYSKLAQEYSCSELLPSEKQDAEKDDDDDQYDDCYDIERFGTAGGEEEILDAVFNMDLKEQLLKIISTLTEKEAQVIKWRYGIGCEAHTFKEIEEHFHIGNGYATQIEKRALRKLRHPNRSSRVIDYLD